MTLRVLVTGAGGFVGAAIARGLADLGHAVIATDAAFDTAARARLTDLRLVEAPLPEALAALAAEGAAPRLDAVVHAAAITATPGDIGLTRAAHLRANTDLLTAALDQARDAGALDHARDAGALDHARGAGARRFLFLSSSGIFAGATGDSVTEATPPAATDPYSAAKRAGEILTAGAAEPGFETGALRLGSIFGPFETPRPSRPNLSPVARMIAQARATGTIRLATPDTRRDWTFAPDLARAVHVLLTDAGALPPLLHVTSAGIVSDRELAEMIAARLPGTRVDCAAAGAPGKPPMVSELASPLTGFSWTPLADALDRLLEAPAP